MEKKTLNETELENITGGLLKSVNVSAPEEATLPGTQVSAPESTTLPGTQISAPESATLPGT